MKRFLLVILLLLLAPVSVLAQDDDDRGFLTRTIENALSGAGREVRIDGFAGALSSEASFQRMTIADDEGVWLTLDDVQLVWSRTALLRGRLQVDRLSARSLQLARLPVSEETAELPSAEAQGFSFELPELPVTVNIDAFEVAEIDLGEPILGVPARLSLAASARLDDDGLRVAMTANRIDEVFGAFVIDVDVARAGSEIFLDVNLDEAPGGIAARLLKLPGNPSVSLKVSGEGPLDDFATDISLATDGVPRLSGQVQLLAEGEPLEGVAPSRRVRADLGGDITALVAPDYRDFFGPDVGLRVDTLLQGDGAIDVEAFAIEAQAVNLTGAVRLNQDLWPTFIDVAGEISRGGPPVLLPGGDAALTVGSVVLDVEFDAANNDALRGRFDIVDLVHDALSAKQVQLTLDGELHGSLSHVGQFLADVGIDATGVSLGDARASRALGQNVSGTANINYIEGQPIRISDLSLTGEDYGLNGQIIVRGLENGFPTRLNLSVAARDLSRFAELAGQSLAGAAELSVRGMVTPLVGTFDLAVSGLTQDLALAIPQADAVLMGRTALSLNAARDTTGTFVRDLALSNDAIDMTADAALRSMGSDVTASVRLVDVALVLPQYQGPLSVEAAAQQTPDGWRVQAKADAPYDTRLSVDGLATGPDADIRFDLVVPEVRPYVATVNGPLSAQGRVWQSPQGYRIDVAADGPYQATVTAEGLATGPEALLAIRASLPDVSVFVPEISGPLDLDGEVARQGEQFRVDTAVRGPAGTTAKVAGTVAADASDVDLELTGEAPLGLSGPFLAPRSLQGQSAFDLTLRGAPSLDAVSGRVSIEGARFTAPNLRLTLNDLQATADISGGAADIDAAGNIAAGGRVTVRGRVNLASLAADLAIALQNAVLADPRLYVVALNGNVDIDGPLAAGARISGQINVDEANLTVPSSGLTSIGEIPFITHVGSAPAVVATRQRAGIMETLPANGAAQSSGPGYPLDITISAPSRIYVRGRGLNAELGGALQLRGDTNTIISSGSFELIRGRLDIIGKRFDLNEGSVQFQGSVTPYIRFVTTTAIPDGSATITVEGLATEPEITFTSVPEAPQDEVLSLIIFGRYVSQLSAFQALELVNGLAELSGRKGVGVLGKLRQGVGLDELDVTTTETGATEITAGKYITEDIYTDVTTNDQLGTDISLNIDLTDDLTAKATVGEQGEGSIGLFFERDY